MKQVFWKRKKKWKLPITKCNLIILQDADSENAKVFKDVAESIDGYKFAITSNADVMSEYKGEDGKVVVFKKVRDEFLKCSLIPWLSIHL